MTSELDLVALARSGERKAFEQLLAPYVGRLRRHIGRLVMNATDTEDVLQDTLLAAWLGLPSFEGRSSVYTWLYRVGHNTALAFITQRRRREARRLRGGILDDQTGQAAYEPATCDTPEAILEATQRLAALTSDLSTLDADRRTAFLECAYFDKSYEQVAVATGVPIGTVRSRVHRARAALGLLDQPPVALRAPIDVGEASLAIRS